MAKSVSTSYQQIVKQPSEEVLDLSFVPEMALLHCASATHGLADRGSHKDILHADTAQVLSPRWAVKIVLLLTSCKAESTSDLQIWRRFSMSASLPRSKPAGKLNEYIPESTIRTLEFLWYFSIHLQNNWRLMPV